MLSLPRIHSAQAKICPENEYTMYFDGCSKKNPGPSGAGAVIFNNKEEIWGSSIFVGHRETNNVAEYSGLILGLKQARDMNIRNLIVYGDSLLVIKQMNKQYKISAVNLVPLFKEAQELKKEFDTILFVHIYRTQNKRADELSNIGLCLHK
jgi:ribonuclease HI